MSTSTWNTQPATGEWNAATNWTPSEAPTNTATFATSSQTTITFSATGEATVGNIEFTDNASAFTFTFGPSATPPLTITGQGISNRSRAQQSFIVAATSSGYKDPQLKFINSASAGGDDMFYCAGPETEQGYGGGVICFCDNSTAGSATFKVWTGAGTPPKHSTVGGEVSFCDSSSASTAHFKIYGTLGTDGDTFGNVVFHDTATAANATFINVGGTVSGGDGGNTQFYGNSSAAYGIYNNYGGTYSKANGGDVAFDATADGGHGHYYNHAAKAAGAYGGVTSFNNNPPHMTNQGASAGHGTYFNYGAREGEQGGGGHLEFSAKYGSPTGANATIANYGSTIASKSSAGHTVFSINLPTDYYPTAGNATIWNHPGVSEGTAAGFTEFSVYGTGAGSHVPTAGDGTFFNLGGYTPKATGGYTVFSGTSSAGNATLIAYGGTHGGYGGRIVFYGESSGGTAKVELFGNGALDIGDHLKGLTIGALELTGGIIVTQLGTETTGLTVSGELTLKSSQANFSFWKKDDGGFSLNTPYTILTNANLSMFTAEQFSGNSIEGVEPTFSIVGNDLQVSFLQA
ncbi:hypothetical protein [Sedimenticola sp.]|uniref:hypothetical protein n=1 Tax=Sedimenticola sp. TaxID=1940285 RepID=UPI003D12D348